ncbi:hypothetical protein [Actinacidiphila guanduensis]|uniref:hypothetical protein n=1 Tax=Actinacidiphila guanduensis TaxID=310781 RepID=UPI00115FC496|nr:hypothetical protein [Actinacidiphila guanduensis]
METPAGGTQSEAPLGLADDVAESIRRHALLVSFAADDPSSVADETRTLQSLLEAYFQSLPEDLQRLTLANATASAESDVSGPEKRSGGQQVELTVAYRVECASVEKAIETAHRSARRNGRKSSCAPTGGTVTDAVGALFLEDGWKFGDYDREVIQLVGESWQCRRIP